MRLMILATAATLALGVAGCQRQPQQEPAGETAVPEESMGQPMEQPMEQQPAEPGAQESVIPEDDTTMQQGATAPTEEPADIQDLK